jgi:hypothetical protein
MLFSNRFEVSKEYIKLLPLDLGQDYTQIIVVCQLFLMTMWMWTYGFIEVVMILSFVTWNYDTIVRNTDVAVLLLRQ